MYIKEYAKLFRLFSRDIIKAPTDEGLLSKDKTREGWGIRPRSLVANSKHTLCDKIFPGLKRSARYLNFGVYIDALWHAIVHFIWGLSPSFILCGTSVTAEVRGTFCPSRALPGNAIRVLFSQTKKYRDKTPSSASWPLRSVTRHAFVLHCLLQSIHQKKHYFK